MKLVISKYSLLSFFSGMFFVLAFEPVGMPGFAFISSGLFFYLLNKQSIQSFKTGFIYGLGKYTFGVSWLFLPIENFTDTPFLIALILTLLLLCFLSCYEGVAAFVFCRFFKKKNSWPSVFAFASLMTAFEIFRSTAFSGFPWLLFGYSQTLTPLKHLAPIIGTFGISFIGYFLSSVLILALSQSKLRYQYVIFFVLPFLCCFLIKDINWTKREGEKLSVALVQANIKHQKKWSYLYFQSLVDTYTLLTNESFDSDLIIWPETALPLPNTDIEDILNYLDGAVKKHHKHLILGLPYEKAKNNFSNAMILLGDKNQQVYEKEHLVPFGEYLPASIFKPLLSLFDIPFMDMVPGSSEQPLININGIYIAPFICYEVAFSDVLRERLPQANLLLTISDDSWYGHSFLKAQHLQIASMRSLESERPQLFSTNDGITAFISEKGEVVRALEPNVKAVLKTTVYPRVGQTLWARFGDIPVTILIAVLLILSSCLPNVKSSALFTR